ncbi:MAG: hypothetical protein LCH95_24025 [Proteobacteria bacterium]|nr:hypothetical protein [Pseudomonadota bacterium]
MQAIELTDGDGTWATIVPAEGGTLRRYARRTRRGVVEVLHEPGCPVLFPIAGYSHGGGRIDHYAWQGVVRPMPIHGFAMRLPWQVVERTASSVRLALAASDATRDSYPFGFRLGLTWALDGGALRGALEVTNDGKGPLPFSAGFHPYIRLPLTAGGRRDRCAIRLPACREHVARPQGIAAEGPRGPRELRATEPAAPARSFAEFDALAADIMDEASGLCVRLDADLDSRFRCLTAWSPQVDAPFYCVEPRTALQDAFTYAADGQLTVLDPGASFAARLSLELHES